MCRNLMFLILSPVILFSQPATERDLEIAAKFEYRSHTFEDIALPYRLFIPENYDSTLSYPLVLTLHGSGERGSDNNRHILDHRMATSWADSINQVKYPCFVIAPQAPANGSWVDYYNIEITRVPASPYLEAANDAVTALINEFNIDTTRLYVTGLSMGGYGTWDLILRYPERYACAIPMSGGGDYVNLGRCLHMPVWNFHGRQDASVSVNESTILFDRFGSFGREPIYTHCNSSDCTGMTEEEIQNKLDEGNDLIFTEYENGGHVIWADSYDYPLLFPWVFRQYFIKNAVTITSIEKNEIISDQHEIRWITGNTAGSVDLYYSKDLGINWELVERGAPADVPYQWNSSLFNDAPFVTLKLVLRDENNIAFSYTDSELFTIDNEGNGTPFVRITNKKEFDNTNVVSEEVTIEFLAADPEQEDLSLTLFYSDDDGENFNRITNSEIVSSGEIRQLIVNISNLRNSSTAILKLAVSDGVNTAYDYTYRFNKETFRNNANDMLSLDKANFDVPFNLFEVNPSERNNHKYRITFDDTSSESETYYSIFDLTAQSLVIENEPVISNNESVIFGGLSFNTSGDKTAVDPEQSGWNGTSSQQSPYTVSPFVASDLHQEDNGYAAPFDYQIEYHDSITGSSAADTLANLIPPLIFPSMDVDFNVRNTTTDKYVEFVYFNTGSFVKTSTIYFMEEMSGWKTRTWRTVIYGMQDDFAKEGDTLFINTYKGLSIFDTVIVDPGLVSTRQPVYPAKYTLSQNYPNPFNPATSIEYLIPEVTEKGQTPFLKQVSLIIYDILGREITTLVNKAQTPGRYTVEWDAAGYASGVYFYRLHVSSGINSNEFSEIKKMVLLK